MEGCVEEEEEEMRPVSNAGRRTPWCLPVEILDALGL